MLRTATVEESTLVLLKKLQQIPLFSELRLVGGTALALQLGHRISIDLDFFGKIEASSSEIEQAFISHGCKILKDNDTKNIKQYTVDNIKVDIVNYPYPWLRPCIDTDGIRMAGIQDIAAMKLSAITTRATRKDFVDLYFLFQNLSLQEMLQLYELKYPNDSIFFVLKSLGYFADAENTPMPQMLSPISWNEIKDCIRNVIKQL